MLLEIVSFINLILIHKGVGGGRGWRKEGEGGEGGLLIKGDHLRLIALVDK